MPVPPAAVPGSISSRCGLGAEGSSLFCSTGDGETLTGVSEEPVALWPVVDDDGVVVSPGLDVLGNVVVSVAPGFVVVCATAGIVAISIVTAAEYMRESIGHLLQDAPAQLRKLGCIVLVP